MIWFIFYDIKTGEIKGLAKNKNYEDFSKYSSLEINEEDAKDFMSGKKPLNQHVVKLNKETNKRYLEKKFKFPIVPKTEDNFYNIPKNSVDAELIVYKKENGLIFKLTNIFFNSYTPTEIDDFKKTVPNLEFYITEVDNPYYLHKEISINFSDLCSKEQFVEILCGDVSIFTTPILKEYKYEI